jgi:hypothetical protein
VITENGGGKKRKMNGGPTTTNQLRVGGEETKISAIRERYNNY